MVRKILVVEDDLDLNEGIKFVLENDTTEILQAYSLAEAKKQLNQSFDLILLDINLPDGNGIDFCKMVKLHSNNRPVIFISANDTDIDVIRGLELGGDDYIIKPFSLMVLRARVETVIKRYQTPVTGENYRDQNYSFDFDTMTYTCKGDAVFLSNAEQKLLKVLVTNKRQIMRKEKIIEFVWGIDGEYIEENALAVVIKRLRKKLEMDSDSKNIKSIYGIGYKWENLE
ncbi:response regulator transcription factor [Pseudolactococcus yaeyamensis]